MILAIIVGVFMRPGMHSQNKTRGRIRLLQAEDAIVKGEVQNCAYGFTVNLSYLVIVQISDCILLVSFEKMKTRRIPRP
ncbi:hypothetical protein K2173_017405 [Erythroxylum novogranatense]|uniref:Uncharacterized protein n=1 Tax=Erythroxylum novogranatense TaxID=1862640 RepID=A0AAV8TKF4_9ROSI|nr:hypothetical protein K2173_017405 [Erythroxylum novogranatense]